MAEEARIEAIQEATEALLRRATVPQRQLPAPTYDGNQDLEGFLVEFYRIVELNRWEDEEL